MILRHPSGAEYHGPARYALEWWAQFDKPKTTDPEPEQAPKVVGTGTMFLGGPAGDEGYDQWNSTSTSPKPLAFGFQPEEK